MTRAPDRSFVVTRAEFARLIGVTPDRVTKFAAEGLPVLETGGGRGRQTRIDLAAALPWLLKRRAGTLDAERSRYFSLQADKIEQEIRFRAGELVEAGAVEKRWATQTLAARERLLQLPTTAMQRGLIAPEHEQPVSELVSDALRELAARGGYVEP